MITTLRPFQRRKPRTGHKWIRSNWCWVRSIRKLGNCQTNWSKKRRKRSSNWPARQSRSYRAIFSATFVMQKMISSNWNSNWRRIITTIIQRMSLPDRKKKVEGRLRLAKKFLVCSDLTRHTRWDARGKEIWLREYCEGQIEGIMCQTSLAEPVIKKVSYSRAIASQTPSCLIPWPRTEIAIQWKLCHSKHPTWKACKLKAQITTNYCNPMKKLIKNNRMPTCKWCRPCHQIRQKWLRSGIKNWAASIIRWLRLIFFTSRSTNLTLVWRTHKKSGSLS